MSKIIKRIIASVLLATLCCGVFCSCVATTSDGTVYIPDIEHTDAESAKIILAQKGIVPKFEYEYSNDHKYDTVIRTEPGIATAINKYDSVTIYICAGPLYREASNTIGWINNIDGIDDFMWASEDPDGVGTKDFKYACVKEGYFSVRISLNCNSKHDLSFYGDFGTASLTEDFSKSVPMKVIYDSKEIDNKGGLTRFELQIPLDDLGEKKPTNIYTKNDIVVNGERETFETEFTLSWD